MSLYVDRIENKIAICFDEDGNMIKINIKKISGKFCEGCILERNDSGFFVDEVKTRLKRQKIFDLQAAVFCDDETD